MSLQLWEVSNLDRQGNKVIDRVDAIFCQFISAQRDERKIACAQDPLISRRTTKETIVRKTKESGEF
jgi:hypothetical protein